MFVTYFLALTMKIVNQERINENQKRELKKQKRELKELKALVRELSEAVFSVKNDRDYYDDREDA